MRGQKARLPKPRFSTTITGMLRVTIPVIGPTASWSWLGSKSSPPFAASAAAASRSSAQPSSTTAPATAPRIGPHMRVHSTGGPAWSTRRSRIPGTTSSAGRTSASTGSPRSSRSTATRLAASTRSPRDEPASRRSARARAEGAAEGGDQSTSATSTPAARRSAENCSSPTLTTRKGPASNSIINPRTRRSTGRGREHARSAIRSRVACTAHTEPPSHGGAGVPKRRQLACTCMGSRTRGNPLEKPFHSKAMSAPPAHRAAQNEPGSSEAAPQTYETCVDVTILWRSRRPPCYPQPRTFNP